MMYANRFVCSVKVNGKILREQSGIVTLPFGCEYEILVKNLNSRRAMVNVSVDGQDATDGKVIIGANATVVLERFIKNGNLRSGNRFKFIERTAGIESHRGIKADDGLIRAEFWSEKEVIDQPIIRRHYFDEYIPVPKPYYPDPPYDPWRPVRPWRWDDGIRCCASDSQTTTAQGIGEYQILNFSGTSGTNPGESINVNMMKMASDAGITVPGSESNQQFYRTSGFQLETNSSVIVLQLRGEVGGVAVVSPVTVEQKPTCYTCGKVNRATNKFCDQCGTALVLI